MRFYEVDGKQSISVYYNVLGSQPKPVLFQLDKS